MKRELEASRISWSTPHWRVNTHTAVDGGRRCVRSMFIMWLERAHACMCLWMCVGICVQFPPLILDLRLKVNYKHLFSLLKVLYSLKYPKTGTNMLVVIKNSNEIFKNIFQMWVKRDFKRQKYRDIAHKICPKQVPCVVRGYVNPQNH